MILDEGHIEKDTIKYARPLHDGVYQDTIIRIGFILKEHHDKMSVENILHLKLAQATICQLGLEKELEVVKEISNGI